MTRCFFAFALALAACDPPATDDGDARSADRDSGSLRRDSGAEPDRDAGPRRDGGPRPDSGGIAGDDVPYTLTGAGFGENDPADQLWLGGRSGYLETHAVGTDITREPRWASDTRGNGVTQVSDAAAWSYAHSLAADAATAPDGEGDTSPWPGIFDASYDTGSHIDRITLRYMVRWDDQSEALGLEPLENMQWKMVRLCYGPRVSDDAVPNVLLSNWIGQATLGRQSGDGVTSWFDPEDLPRIDGGWYSVELEFVLNDPLAESNGTFHARVRRMDDGVITMDETLDDVQYIAPGDDNGFFQWIVFQNYQGNLNQGTSLPAPPINPSRVLMDDVYAISGGSGRYLVLANAARWDDVTHEEVQYFDAWSDGEIHIPHLNLGAFESAEGLYFYVKTSPSEAARADGISLE
jgi:hypothetical protein